MTFGETDSGERVELFKLSGGVEVSIITYGAAVQSVLAPGRDGRRANVALGFPALHGYAANAGHYFGATVGRYANRIAAGRFNLAERHPRQFRVIDELLNPGRTAEHRLQIGQWRNFVEIGSHEG